MLVRLQWHAEKVHLFVSSVSGIPSFFAEVATSQDVPGFVSNALLMPFINEAIICLEKVLTIHRLVSIYN